MSERTFQVGELAERSGVTVRTLHHYDEIGLLVPQRSPAGFRLYGERQVLRLQEILLYREQGLPLEEIRRILDDPGYDPTASLRAHRARLARALLETNARIRAIDAALVTLKGRTMELDEIFEGFDPAAFEAEAKERWGGTAAYREAARRTSSYSAADWKGIEGELGDLLERLARLLRSGIEPSHPSATALAEEHRQHLERWYYPCPPAMHAGLGEMYVADERFRTTFERRQEGLAAYLSAAIRANGERAG